MHISKIEKATLVKLLERVVRVTPLRTPILEMTGVYWNAYRPAAGGFLQLIGGDFDMTVEIAEKPGQVLLAGEALTHGRQTLKALKAIPKGEISVHTDQGNLVFTHYSSGAKIVVPQFSAEELESFVRRQAETGKLRVMVATIRGLDTSIGAVTVAASDDDSRPVLQQVLLDREKNHLRLVATDSYRLAILDLPCVAAPKKPVLVPAKALRELSKTIGIASRGEAASISLTIGESQVRFDSGNGTLTAKILENNYVQYHNLLPVETTDFLVVRETFVAAVQRAAQACGSSAETRDLPVRLKFVEGGLILRVVHNGKDIFTEKIVAVEPLDFVELDEVAFNCEYLLDGLKFNQDGIVTFKVTTKLKPAVITGPGSDAARYTYLVMPVRL